MFQKQEHLKNLARCKPSYSPYLIRDIPGSYSFTSNLVIIKVKAEIGSCRSFFGRSVANSEITGPYQFLLKIIWNIVFLK